MDEIELRDVALFSEMDDLEVAEIRAIMDETAFKPGQTIIREGELGNLFYVITAGQVQVSIRNAEGEDIVLQELGPGGFFGELSMLTSEPRQARVRAMNNVVTLALERDEFFGFLQKRPSAAIDVLVELGGRLHNMDAIIRRSASRNVNQVDAERLTLGQRIADTVADTMGSWRFIIVQSTALAIWIMLNATAWINHWDPLQRRTVSWAVSGCNAKKIKNGGRQHETIQHDSEYGDSGSRSHNSRRAGGR